MATASELPMPRSVFYDASGKPLNGGFVNTYVQATTTPKLTWQDAGETIPNANPVPLDSAGSCLLYGSGAYSIAVTDSLGNAIPAYSGVTQGSLFGDLTVGNLTVSGNLTGAAASFSGAVSTGGPISTSLGISAGATLSGNALTVNTASISGTCGITGALTCGAGGSFAASLGSPGFQKLPSGQIKQFGTATTVAGGGVNASYSIAFPTSVLSFQATITGAGGPVALTIAVGTPGLTFTNVWIADSPTGTGHAGISFYWEAIGV
jgi:hypothetical protein